MAAAAPGPAVPAGAVKTNRALNIAGYAPAKAGANFQQQADRTNDSLNATSGQRLSLRDSVLATDSSINTMTGALAEASLTWEASKRQ